MLKASVLSPFVSQQFVMLISKVSQEDLTILSELIEAGKVKPVIDRHYSLSEVSEVIRYLETGHARGKVAGTIHSPQQQATEAQR